MKKECVCGYKYEETYNIGTRSSEITGGYEKFIEIAGNFTIESDANLGGPIARKVKLYACPRCETVQLDRW